jgi:hypothetical protein
MMSKPLIDNFLASVERGLAKPLVKHPEYLVVPKDEAVAARDFIKATVSARVRGGQVSRGGGRKIRLRTEKAKKNREYVRKHRKNKKESLE